MSQKTSPDVTQELLFDFDDITSGSAYITVSEDVNGIQTNIGSLLASAKGTYTLNVKPNQTNIKVSVLGTYSIWMVLVCKKVPQLQQETMLVDVCNGVKDRYRFGFNGQEKVNEWAGIGNYVDFGARGLDTRVGRWMAVDPLSQKYPDLSPYAYVGNNPIIYLDPDGKRIVLSHRVFIKGKLKPVITNVIYDHGILTNSDGSIYTGNDEYILNAALTVDDVRAQDERLERIFSGMERDNVNGVAVDHFITNDIGRFAWKETADGEVLRRYVSSGSEVQSTYNIFDKKPEEMTEDQWKAQLLSISIRFVPDLDKNRPGDPTTADFTDGSILAHESKHWWNKRTGSKREGVNSTGLRKEEVDAMHIENIFRKAKGMNPRTTYSVDREGREKKMEEGEIMNLDSYILD